METTRPPARPRARFERAVRGRYAHDDRLVLVIDPGRKSGKLDHHELAPSDARILAAELLIAAERAEGRQVML